MNSQKSSENIFTILTDLTEKIFFIPETIKGSDIDYLLSKYNSPLLGCGDFILDVQRYFKVSGYFILALAEHESLLGKSDIALNTKNLFGWNAVDISPQQSAWRFNTYQGCIAVVMWRIKEKYFNKLLRVVKIPNLLNMDDEKPNELPDYSSDVKWDEKVCYWMNRFYKELKPKNV